MIVEREVYSKENTNPSSNNAGNSDDSYSGASFPWFPSQNRRKSRLGTYRKERIRVLQDVVPNIDVPAECKLSTPNPELKADEPANIPTRLTVEVSEVPHVSPQSTSVPTFEQIAEGSAFVDTFELPPARSMSLPFCSFKPISSIPSPLGCFTAPSPPLHSTTVDAFESINSLSTPSTKVIFSPPPPPASSVKPLSVAFEPISSIHSPSSCFKTPSRSPHSTTANAFESISSLSTPSTKVIFSPPPPPASSVKPLSLAFEPISSVHSPSSCFKTPSRSPHSTTANAFESINTLSALSAELLFPPPPPVNNVKPFSVVKESNNILKSSLKKPTCPVNEEKDVIVDQPQPKPLEQSPRKGVRFAEPNPPLSKSTTQKPTKDIASSITVKNKTYRVWRELGTGGSCVVYEVFDSEMNDSLAIKRVVLPDDEDLAYVAQGYLEEVKMLEKLRGCENIITIYDHELVYENGRQVLYVVLEKGETDLSKYMRNIGKKNKLFKILLCWGQMLIAVNRIHEEDIIHLDLKPANFLFVKGELKLIDFGIASAMPSDKTSIYLNATSGTLSYTSPESLSMTHSPVGSVGYRISKKSDVWSLGCILYRWIYGYAPFHTSLNKWQRLQDIMSPDKKVDFPERMDIPESLLRTMQSCLEKDPKKRPTVQELLQMKWDLSFDQ